MDQDFLFPTKLQKVHSSGVIHNAEFVPIETQLTTQKQVCWLQQALWVYNNK